MTLTTQERSARYHAARRAGVPAGRPGLSGDAWYAAHGFDLKANHAAELSAYISAKQRTTNPKNPRFADYGGRGIRFLFESFEQFLEVLGRRPGGLTLDRINNDGDYAPGNVRWADRKTQAANKRPRSPRGPYRKRQLAQ